MQETLDKTSLLGVTAGDRVNLERAVTVEKRLGGHIVQGHVDGVGEVVRRTPSEHWEVVEISMPPEFARYLVDKGSITVDGVSLTVVEALEESFTVSLIPETLARTTLGARQPGDRVNLEFDVIAKHVEKLLVGAVDRDQGRLEERSSSERRGPARQRRARPSRTSPPARRSSSSTTRTARTRATSSSPPPRRPRS